MFRAPLGFVSATALAVALLAGCSTELNVRPTTDAETLPADPDSGFATPMPSLEGVLAELAAGEVPVEIPEEWGEPEQSPRVDEGYVLQDFTWFLDGNPEGDIVTAAGMTPAQAESLSGGTTFDEHVAGLAEVLAFEEGEPATVTRSEFDGSPAARLDASTPDGMRIVLWLYDLGDAFYEFGYYGAPGTTPGPERLDQFDAVAQTFTTPGAA
jgi:hypothetical protein